MQKDFHYYCVAVLARAAGFKSEDALTIAYASQYVDDATEPLTIRVDPEEGEEDFSPTHTAYNLFMPDQAVKTLGREAPREVLMAFHFLPPVPDGSDYVVRQNSQFAQEVLRHAQSLTGNPRRALCALGVALHTFADTWAHEGFSGRRARENQVEALQVYERSTDTWRPLPGLSRALPRTGHAEAGHLPDLPHKRWLCDVGRSKRVMERNNAEHFRQAARTIYTTLDEMQFPAKGPAEKPWEDIEPKVISLFRAERLDIPTPSDSTREGADVERLPARCASWQQEFGDLFERTQDGFRTYDERYWRGKALEGDLDWKRFRESGKRIRRYKGRARFWDSFWVHFHQAAAQQRDFVRGHLSKT